MTIDQASRLQVLARWHRRLAMLVAAWLTVLAGTGILINHANDWGLDRRPIPATLQHWVYGIAAGGEDHCAGTDLPPTACHDIFARLELTEGSVLLGEGQLLLLDGQGRLVERIPAAQAGLERFAAGFTGGNSVYLADGTRTVRSGPGLLGFQALDTAEAAGLAGAAWKEAETRGVMIHWERLLLDLHAARFLGPLSKIFNDLAATTILLLAFSGYLLNRLKRRVNGGGISAKQRHPG